MLYPFIHPGSAYAAVALGYLAANHTGNQVAIADAGAITPLMEMLPVRGDARPHDIYYDPRGRRSTAMWVAAAFALGHLADGRAIRRLTLMFEAVRGDAHLMCCAAVALGHIAANHRGNQDAIADAGAIELLVQGFVNSINNVVSGDQAQALNGLVYALHCAVSKHPKNRRKAAAAIKVDTGVLSCSLAWMVRTGNRHAKEVYRSMYGFWAALTAQKPFIPGISNTPRRQWHEYCVHERWPSVEFGPRLGNSISGLYKG